LWNYVYLRVTINTTIGRATPNRTLDLFLDNHFQLFGALIRGPTSRKGTPYNPSYDQESKRAKDFWDTVREHTAYFYIGHHDIVE
jgi:hypothetical protein